MSSTTEPDTHQVPDESGPRRRGFFQRMLDGIEVAGNKLPHPASLFALLAALVVAMSWLLDRLGVSAEHPVEVDDAGDPVDVEVFNLASSEGIEWMFTSMIPNFIEFAPLGVVLATMIGIGMAEQSGLIGTALRSFILAVPRTLVTFAIVFAGLMSSVASDAGYIILPPLAAMLFAALGRHPLAGIAAGFAGVSAGFSANFLLSGTDVLLGEATIEAAATYDPEYAEQMNLAMNWWFIIASTVVLAIVGTLVSRFIVEPRLGTWEGAGVIGGNSGEAEGESEGAGDEGALKVTRAEKLGLLWAGASLVVTVAALLLLIVPENAPLRGDDGAIVQSPFMTSLAVPIIIAFFVPGLVYGIVTKSVRSDTDAINLISKTLAGMAVFLVMAFTAGQFVAYFNESGIGTLVSVYGAEALDSINLTGIPLVLAFMLFVGVVNLFVGSASAKWFMLAPVMVPIMMQLGLSCDFVC